MSGVVVTIDATQTDAREKYEAVGRELGAVGQNPPGGLFRVAGPITGGWRVVSGWESREAWETFRNQNLMPTLQKVGVQPVRIEIWPVEDVQTRS
jgi:hypothetical protein